MVVGDGAVGKTCLCNVFVNRRFPKDYVPTCFENHAKEMVVDGQVRFSTKRNNVFLNPMMEILEETPFRNATPGMSIHSPRASE